MARGWESKSVESQMEAATETKEKRQEPSSEEEKESHRERDTLLLSRSYILHQIELSTNERYTESLRKALNELEQKIAVLNGR